MIYIGETQVLGSYLGEEQAEEVFVGEEVVISGTTSGDTPASGTGITMVESISADQMGWDISKYIELPFTMSTAFTFNLKFETYCNNDRAIGYSWEDIGSAGDDIVDFRPIFQQGGGLLYDFNDDRLNAYNLHLAEPGYIQNLTIGNYYIYDNVDGVMIVSGTPKSTIASPNMNIRVDVSSFYLRGLEIYSGNTKVFDGYPAIDVNSNNEVTRIGLHDVVSGQFIWNSGITMQYNGGCGDDPVTGIPCLCAARGGTWDDINQECIESGEGGGEESSSSEDTGVYCECIDSRVYSQEECDCICQGGEWDSDEGVCLQP